MTVYIDRPRNTHLRPYPVCHLAADDLGELLAFAEKIGLKRSQLQTGPGYPHYDLSPAMRTRAVRAGAVVMETVLLAILAKKEKNIMRMIKAPAIDWDTMRPEHPTPTVFLAGGITGCPDWQADIANLLANVPVVLYNPRRDNFPIHDPAAAQAQIIWEHEHLKAADAISFWFPRDTLCPITLYELGTWTASKKPIFIGVHPDYKRCTDVEIQTRLARPEIEITYSLNGLADQVSAWVYRMKRSSGSK